ncbi:aldehyde dehydrogenase family protein [Kitasatospora sp. DSM 101779]|uniref:aldehyde dehydrogenase family protein n=1 Tax=Kitasatospora sp. DSM 101779 TaxID=2853165 RepID=UPI0021D9116D|nr:aldehyde dehydrogenase family protein [Kitasatospora sp. DSM 101779]MCU7824525.1 aldehyde dehydrogenase family protein [Kitasatospora sp. DSM 101779]
MDAVTRVPAPVSEPVRGHAPGSPERERLERRMDELAAEPVPLPMTIAGEQRFGGGERIDVVQPHHHAARLGLLGNATHEDARLAVDAALAAAPDWRALPFDERAAVLLRAADLLAGPWRETIAAATVLGQSTTARQAELDAVCALADLWRSAVHAARRILAEQPESPPGTWRRADHRPLDGFVYALTRFDSTARAGYAATGPALMGNTVVWKPAPAQTLAAHHLMRLLEAAGLPPGVVNLVTGDGRAPTQVALASPALAGLHFTGATETFHSLWTEIAAHLGRYRNHPRIAGATGGKGFLLAHPSADPDLLRPALLHGAFAYQGQNRSAIARAHLPRTLWRRIRADLLAEVDALAVGDVTDLGTAMGALIDGSAYERTRAAVDRAGHDPGVELAAGGQYDDAIGWFVRPTVLECTGGRSEVLRSECPGPVLAVQVYEDADWEAALHRVCTDTPQATAGSVLARDRYATAQAVDRLRFAAAGLHVNDGPGGAGGRVGTAPDLLRWTSARTVEETFAPPAGDSRMHPG